MAQEGYTVNEQIKEDSEFLRGTIASELASSSSHFESGDEFLLKFHGITQQDDRDVRQLRKKEGKDRDWSFMLRLRMPGGRLSTEQWLKTEALADTFGNKTLKLTTRQAVQIHGVVKDNLKETMQKLHEAALTTIAASGDATRNVMVSVFPEDSPIHKAIFDQAVALSQKLEPQTHAYHEIWLDHERVYSGANEEPLYGPTYLPRKFKIGFVLPPENDVDVYTQDLGFVAIVTDGVLQGYDVLVGGGMGYAYGNAESFPRLADLIGFCTPEQVEEVTKQVLLIHKDYSNRCNRKTSRLRYTVAKRGVEWFAQELTQRLGFQLQPARPFTLNSNNIATETESRRVLEIEGGRVVDTDAQKLKTGIHEIAKIHQGSFYITGNQNLVIAGITPDTVQEIDALIETYQLKANKSGLRRRSSACTALPFCPQAFTDSERQLPQVLDALDPILNSLGLWDQEIVVRMTGCPNGCTRPFLSELAFVGKGPKKYNVWLGGSPRGDRLGFIYKESVPVAEIPALLEPVFKQYADEREDGESFGDWSDRALRPEAQ
jgi:sulfite reductase (NADPH) hemoprotein beta-component